MFATERGALDAALAAYRSSSERLTDKEIEIRNTLEMFQTGLGWPAIQDNRARGKPP